MSPEQAAGELDIDGRSDVYSAGVLGYYMLSGKLPFDAPTFESLAARHIAEAHVPVADLAPGAPASLCDTIERAMSKERDQRWRSGREMAAELEATAPTKRRWFRRAARASMMRSRVAAELALIAGVMRAVFKWTMI
jgi:serine/threonine-protein kinase